MKHLNANKVTNCGEHYQRGTTGCPVTNGGGSQETTRWLRAHRAGSEGKKLNIAGH